jgi:hypothetical protein
LLHQEEWLERHNKKVSFSASAALNSYNESNSNSFFFVVYAGRVTVEVPSRNESRDDTSTISGFPPVAW